MFDLKEVNETNAKQYNFACDWLQLHCYLSQDLESYSKDKYLIKRTGQSKVFGNIYTISTLSGYPVATWATDTNECIMEKGHGVLKFDNKQLYINPNLREYVTKFLLHFDFRFIGITRLDLCFDFHTFHNLRQPQNFIKSFVSDKLYKVQSSKILVGGKHTKDTYLESISFGSKSSQCYYKLYNKTREMLANVHKPYIVDAWNTAKLDHHNKDVWRLEFTLSSDTATLLNNYHTSFDYHSLETLDLGNLYGLFVYLYNKHFNFVVAEPAKLRKDRMKKVTLLVLPLNYLKIKRFPGIVVKKDSTRATKIFIKKMQETNDELRIFDENFVVDAKGMVSKLINLYGLEKWATQKFISFDRTLYSQNINDFITATI